MSFACFSPESLAKSEEEQPGRRALPTGQAVQRQPPDRTCAGQTGGTRAGFQPCPEAQGAGTGALALPLGATAADPWQHRFWPPQPDHTALCGQQRTRAGHLDLTINIRILGFKYKQTFQKHNFS